MSTDAEWLHDLFADADRHVAELPAWALPVLTPPAGRTCWCWPGGYPCSSIGLPCSDENGGNPS